MIWKNLLAFTLVLLCSFFAYAAPTQPLSIAEHNALVPSRICLDNAANFQTKGMLAAESYAGAVQECMTQAKTVLGRDISFQELMQKVGTTHELTGAQKVAGALSSLTWMQGLFAVVGAIAGAIFLFHLVPVVTWIPKGVYEVLFYITSLGLTFGGLFVPALHGQYVGLVGTLGFAGSLMFSAWAHKIEPNPVRFCTMVMLFAGVAAYLHQSTLIGYVAVLALLGMGGFAASMGGLCYAIGFKDEAAVPRGTATAFALLSGYLVFRAVGMPDAYLSVFAPGAFFLGSFVFFLGLLILSSKFYKSSYFGWNAMMLVAAFAGIWLGGVLGIPDLSKMAGSFLVLWALEKWFEIPVESILGYSFLTVLGCGIGYYLVQLAMQNAERFGPYLFFIS